MGYYSHFTTDMVIVPPLRWSALRLSHYLDDNGGYNVFWFDVEKNEVDTDDGVAISKTASSLSVYEDDCKGYDWEENLRGILSDVQKAGSTMTGQAIRAGEETGDLERIVIRDGKITREKAKLSWPDGSEAKISV